VKGYSFPGSDPAAWADFNKSASLVAAEVLPPPLAHLLRDLARPDGPDAIVLDNFPVDEVLVPTPLDGQRPAGKPAVSEAVIAGSVGVMGAHMLSYRQEKKGEVLQQLVPIPGEEAKQSNTGRTKFGLHTDNANIPFRFRQQFLGLYGLRNEKDVATLVVTLEDIRRAISPALLRKLRYPIYRFPAPLSFDLGGWHVLSEPRSVIWTDDNGVERIALPRSEFSQEDAEADEAVNQFREFLDQIEPRRVVVGPGRFFIFRDSRVLHGRDAVEGDRWLQRVYISRTLDAHRAATNSGRRVFSFDARPLMMS